jgi:hypothetical protein
LNVIGQNKQVKANYRKVFRKNFVHQNGPASLATNDDERGFVRTASETFFASRGLGTPFQAGLSLVQSESALARLTSAPHHIIRATYGGGCR